MEFLILFISLVVGISIGWNARERHERRLFLQEIEEQQESIRISVEKHNDCYYIYNDVTEEFLAQGKTRKEVEDALHKRFPGKIFAAREEHIKLLHETT